MTALTTRDALAKTLAEHRIVYESDGDYGEKRWIACSCSHLSFGDDYWTGETEEDHERHVAEHLPVIDAATLADDEALIARAGGAVLTYLCERSPVWADRHIGEMEQHIADEVARTALAALSERAS